MILAIISDVCGCTTDHQYVASSLLCPAIHGPGLTGVQSPLFAGMGSTSHLTASCRRPGDLYLDHRWSMSQRATIMSGDLSQAHDDGEGWSIHHKSTRRDATCLEYGSPASRSRDRHRHLPHHLTSHGASPRGETERLWGVDVPQLALFRLRRPLLVGPETVTH